MKNKPGTMWIGVILICLVQLACSIGNLPAQFLCEMEGGKWERPDLDKPGWCVEKAAPAPGPVNENEPENGVGERSTEPPIDPQGMQPTEKYLTPTPASAQECNATLYVQVLIEVTKQTQEQYYRECEYKLSATNVHPSQGIWILRRTNTSVHSSATDLDDSYWYSDLIFPGQFWEQLFRSNYYTNGQFSREGVDRVAGVFDRPDCLYLLYTAEVEAISQPVEWACGP